jgi:hypothetical protein
MHSIPLVFDRRVVYQTVHLLRKPCVETIGIVMATNPSPPIALHHSVHIG